MMMISFLKKQKIFRGNDLEYRDIHPSFGVEIIRGFNPKNLQRHNLVKITSLLRKKGLILIRSSQIMNEVEQLKFTNLLGKANFKVTYITTNSHLPEIKNDSNSLSKPSSQWHSDCSYLKNPSHLGILQMLETPKEEFETYFLNLNGAYNKLGSTLLKEWKNVKVKYSGNDAIHPLLWIHPFTGRPCIYFDFKFALEIFDLCPKTGKILIKDINDALIQLSNIFSYDDNIYRHQWQKGDIIISDNYAVARKESFIFENSHKVLLRRTTTEGIYF